MSETKQTTEVKQDTSSESLATELRRLVISQATATHEQDDRRLFWQRQLEKYIDNDVAAIQSKARLSERERIELEKDKTMWHFLAQLAKEKDYVHGLLDRAPHLFESSAFKANVQKPTRIVAQVPTFRQRPHDDYFVEKTALNNLFGTLDAFDKLHILERKLDSGNEDKEQSEQSQPSSSSSSSSSSPSSSSSDVSVDVPSQPTEGVENKPEDNTDSNDSNDLSAKV